MLCQWQILSTVLASELEPLVSDRNSQDKPKEDFNSEYKKNYRPFTEYADKCVKAGMTNNIEENGLHHDDTEKDIWYRQVVALRKKAGEYKVNNLKSLTVDYI